MSEQQARSFTFRIPADVDDVFRKQVGERERSRFLVQALRRALGMPEEIQSTGFNTDLATQTTELAYKLESYKTEQDKVLQRLTNLEDLMEQVVEKFLKPRLEQDKVLQRLIEAENVDIGAINREVEFVLQKQESSKTELRTPENLVSDLMMMKVIARQKARQKARRSRLHLKMQHLRLLTTLHYKARREVRQNLLSL